MVVVRRPIAYNIQTSHLQNDADVLLISADARYRHTQGGKGAAAIADTEKVTGRWQCSAGKLVDWITCVDKVKENCDLRILLHNLTVPD